MRARDVIRRGIRSAKARNDKSEPMQLAKVIAAAVATVKHDSLRGRKLLLVAPLMADGRSVDGDPLLAVDGVGAGRGEIVVITSDGRGAAQLLGRNDSPVRWTISGIKDS